LAWNPDHPGGGAYLSTARNVLSVSDVSSTLPRHSTGARTSGTPTNFRPAYVPPEVAEARAFEERLHGAWLLIPASPQTEMPLLDGAAVPVITSNQWAYIPESWCQNLHRAWPEPPRQHADTEENRT
jgi:hypothetical protein